MLVSNEMSPRMMTSGAMAHMVAALKAWQQMLWFVLDRSQLQLKSRALLSRISAPYLSCVKYLRKIRAVKSETLTSIDMFYAQI